VHARYQYLDEDNPTSRVPYDTQEMHFGTHKLISAEKILAKLGQEVSAPLSKKPHLHQQNDGPDLDEEFITH